MCVCVCVGGGGGGGRKKAAGAGGGGGGAVKRVTRSRFIQVISVFDRGESNHVVIIFPGTRDASSR